MKQNVGDMLVTWGIVTFVKRTFPGASVGKVLGQLQPSEGKPREGKPCLEQVLLDAAMIDKAIDDYKAPMMRQLLEAKYVYGWKDASSDPEKSMYVSTFDLAQWARENATQEVLAFCQAYGGVPIHYVSKALKLFELKLAMENGWEGQNKKSA